MTRNVVRDRIGPVERRRLYLDTSAYLCVLLGERESAALTRELADADLFSSVLLVLESNRTLVRLSREGVLSPSEFDECRARVREDLGRLRLRDLSLDLCGEAPMPLVSTPRSLDLAHLRTALGLHQQSPIERFVTLDEAQRFAAREIGLPT